MATIIQTGPEQYFLKIRGSEMTLERYSDGWLVRTSNASAKAWNRGCSSFKAFESLEAIENHYKSWRGIRQLVEADVLALCS